MDSTTIATTITGICSATIIAVIDHYLSKSESILQNSVGPFVWALITRKPVKIMKGQLTMATKFNFDTFLTNFGKAATSAAQNYEAKQAAGQSLHQVDYINMGISAAFAILSAFHSDSAASTTAQTNEQ